MPKVHNVWDHPPLHGEEPCEIGSWDFHPDKERTDASVWKQDVVETPCGKRDSWDSETDLAPSESSFGEQSEGASTHWEDGSDGEQGRSAEIGPGVRQGSAESVSSNAWTSLSCLDGSWVGRGEMQGGSLRWYHDGPSVSVTVVGRNTIELHRDGCRHRGELQADGRLYWEDGDIWTRDTVEHASQPCAAAGFGFRLHSEVHVLGASSESPTSEPGLVVGFTESQVEVKHTDRITRYFPCNLKSAAAEQVCQTFAAAGSRRPVSETEMGLGVRQDRAESASNNAWTRLSCFDGSWVGRGDMQGGSLRWYHDGPSVSFTVVGRNTIELHLDGCRHRGELRADGRLYWEDGDIWTRDTVEHARQPCAAAGFGFRLHSEVHVLG